MQETTERAAVDGALETPAFAVVADGAVVVVVGVTEHVAAVKVPAVHDDVPDTV